MNWRQCTASALSALSLFAAPLLLSTPSASARNSPTSLASRILSQAHNTTGFILHLGATDLDLSLSLSADGRFLVKAITFQPDRLDTLRQHVLESGVYGLVTIDHSPATERLPLVGDLVDVLVIDDLSASLDAGLDLKEALRVMGSYATACIRIDGPVLESTLRDAFATEITDGLISSPETLKTETGNWLTFRKNKPHDWDAWPYSTHGPDGNAHSSGDAPDQPTSLRYYTGRAGHYGAGWGREVTSGDGRILNSYNGRVLEARNIDNGMLLWSIPFVGRAVGINSLPVNGKVYAYLNNELISLRARDGKNRATFYKAEHTPREVLLDSEVVIGVDDGGVHAFEESSAEPLWSFPDPGASSLSSPNSLVSSGKHAFFIYGNSRRGESIRIRAVNIHTGKLLWDEPAPGEAPPDKKLSGTRFSSLLYSPVEEILFVQASAGIHALGAQTGAVIYTIENGDNRAPTNLRTINPIIYDGSVALTYAQSVELRDLATGELQREIRYREAITKRCQTPKIVNDKLYIGFKNHVSLDTGEVFANQVIKVLCKSGFHVAHGKKIGVIPTCLCFPMLRGYVALADPPTHRGEPTTERIAQRVAPSAVLPEATSADWPMQGGDLHRSGSRDTPMPDSLEKEWTLDLPARPPGPITSEWENNPFVRGPYSQAVIKGSIGVLAAGDTHQVMSFDATSGQLRWTFLADNKVDTAPTLYRGAVYFGTRQGTLYCLDLETGEEHWQVRIAPHTGEGILNWSSLESPWPAPGSVYIENDMLMVTAGLHPEADGGVHVYGIDPSSGEIRWKNLIDKVAVVPTWHEKILYGREAAMMAPVGLFSKDGSKVCMSRYRFDLATGEFRNDPGNGFKKAGTMFAPIEDNYGAPMERVFKTPQSVFNQQYLCMSHSLDRTVICAKANVFDEIVGKNFPSSVLDLEEELVRLDKYKLHGAKTFTQFVAKRAEWAFDVGKAGDLITAMAIADNKLYLTHKPSNLVVLDLATGDALQRVDLGTEPSFQGISIANQSLFVTTNTGVIKFSSPVAAAASASK